MLLISRSPQGLARMFVLLALLVQPNTACNSNKKTAKKVEPKVQPAVQPQPEPEPQPAMQPHIPGQPEPEPQVEVVEEVVEVASRGRSLSAAAPPANVVAAASKCSVGFMVGGAEATHASLMQQLCERGRKNVLVKGLVENVPVHQEAQRRAEQFMVLNLHRDSFSSTPQYHNGVAPDNSHKYFKVDDTIQLSNGNLWYRNGLPLWPLLNQTMKAKKKSIIGTGSTPDWPNFAIGTPIYLIGTDVANFRDPKVSMSKFFAGEVASTPQFAQSACTGTCLIVEPTKFKAAINNLLATKFIDSNSNYKADAASITAYSNWAELLVQESLPLMLKSFKKRQKSRCPKTQCSTCPDELLLFLNQKPCENVSPCPFLEAIQQQLKLAECDTTTMVVGHLAATAG